MISALFPWAGKILSESLLSLYPVFVKNIGVAMPLQMWSRFVAYIAISIFFVNHSFIRKHIFSKWGLILAGVTLVHIFTSYQGFMLLDSGTAFTLFYTYPVIILLLARKIKPLLFAFTLVGVFLLAFGNSWPGLAMVAGAAITEALIYFIVLKLPTKNNWNHLFLSYFAGAIILTVLYPPKSISTVLSLSLGINACIGMFGYLLRFYSMTRLPVFWYALLSNLGVMCSYIYGYVFNRETVGVRQIVGTLIVLTACWFAKKK
jgi:drug/metabolite transporter (DMT)-like permease